MQRGVNWPSLTSREQGEAKGLNPAGTSGRIGR